VAQQSTAATPVGDDQPDRASTRGLRYTLLRIWLPLLVLAGFVYFLVLPMLSSARELSRRMVCASNIKGIGTTWMVYAKDYPGEGVAPLEWLITTGRITPEQTICPSSGLTESNYILLPFEPRDLTDNSTVIAYEPKSNHGGEGGNFLFADGHVSFVRVPEYDQLVRSAERDLPQRSGDDP